MDTLCKGNFVPVAPPVFMAYQSLTQSLTQEPASLAGQLIVQGTEIVRTKTDNVLTEVFGMAYGRSANRLAALSIAWEVAPEVLGLHEEMTFNPWKGWTLESYDLAVNSMYRSFSVGLAAELRRHHFVMPRRLTDRDIADLEHSRLGV